MSEHTYAVTTRDEKHELEFQITNLRQDKIIYAVEATALNLVCLLIFLFSDRYRFYDGSIMTPLNILALAAAVGFTLYMGIGNSRRLLEIRKIEKRLGTR